jgi:hypothetical protein
MSASRIPIGVSILKHPSSRAGRIDKSKATQLAHHSSRISVGSIITVALDERRRGDYGLRL